MKSERLSPTSFCRYFIQHMDGLFHLAYALTADSTAAEEVYMRALDLLRSSEGVSAEWADRASRRAIIKAAIVLVRPMEAEKIRPLALPVGTANEAAVLLALPAFQRFAFTLTTLEKLSIPDAAALMGCSRAEVRDGRDSAMLMMAEAAFTKSFYPSAASSSLSLMDQAIPA